MKYRMLSAEELKLFDQDFKYFLIANGVKNEEWIEMNRVRPDQAEKLVQMFSDSVLEVVYSKVKYLEFRAVNSCLVFKLNDENIELISLSTSSPDIDLSTPTSIHEALLNNSDAIQIFQTSKIYSSTKEEEVHKMLSEGCLNSSEEFWNALKAIMV